MEEEKIVKRGRPSTKAVEETRTVENEKENIMDKKEENITLSKDALTELLANAAKQAVDNYVKTHATEEQQSADYMPNKLVTMIYINNVNKNNITYLDNNRMYSVRQFGDRVQMPYSILQASPNAKDRIKKRTLVVVSGLTKSERRLFDCDYKQGEVMTIEFAQNIFALPNEDVIDIFKTLCAQHRHAVAGILNQEYCNGNGKVDRSLAVALYNIAKASDDQSKIGKETELILESLVKRINDAEMNK